MSNDDFLPVLEEGDSVTFGYNSGSRSFSFVNLLIRPVQGSVLIEIINKKDRKTIKKVIETDTILCQKQIKYSYDIATKLGDDNIFTSSTLIEGTVTVLEGTCQIIKTHDTMYDR